MDGWQNTPVEFASPEVGAAFRERVQLWRDAIRAQKAARVPSPRGSVSSRCAYYGFPHDAYYDYAKLAQAWDKFPRRLFRPTDWP